jgi:hypothetical protein
MSKILLLLLCFLYVGCNYNLQKTSLEFKQTLSPIDQIPSGTVVDYQVITQFILGPRCLECHSDAGGNPNGVNLETYANVTQNLDMIGVMIENDIMPKERPKLSDKEKEVLLTWIAGGGPLHGEAENETTTPPTEN